MALESPFSSKSPLTYFQTPTHQISLFASLNTFNNFFLYKTQKQPIMSLTSQFQLYFTFSSNCSPFALRSLSLTRLNLQNIWPLVNSMSNQPMISPTISDLSETLHTASPLLVYSILKVTAHLI